MIETINTWEEKISKEDFEKMELRIAKKCQKIIGNFWKTGLIIFEDIKNGKRSEGKN